MLNEYWNATMLLFGTHPNDSILVHKTPRKYWARNALLVKLLGTDLQILLTSTMLQFTPGIKVNKSNMSKVKNPAHWWAKTIFWHNPK